MTRLELEDQLEEVIFDASVELAKKDRNRLIDALVEHLVFEGMVELDEDEEDE